MKPQGMKREGMNRQAITSAVLKRPLSLLIAFAAAVGLSAAVILLPGDLERIAMLERDGETEAAAALANRLYEAGDRRSPLLARVFELNHAIGKPRRADEALRLYLAGTPNHRRTLVKAVEFFELEQDLAGTFTVLANLVRVAPASATVDKLARLYRLHGHFEDEERLLLAHRPLLGAELTARLGALLAQSGRKTEALRVLRAADDAFPEDHELFATLLFDLLIRERAVDEAARRAVRWLTRDPNGQRRVPMVVALVEAGAGAAARTVALAPAGAEPEEAEAPLAAVIWTLARRGHAEAAGALVEHLPDCRSSRRAREAAAGYVDFARAMGALTSLLTRIDRLVGGGEEVGRRRGLCLAGILLDRSGLAALAPLRRRLTPDVLAADAMFAAELAMAERQPLAARTHLTAADLPERDEQRAKEWLVMAQMVFTPTDLARELASRRLSGTLPSALIPALQASLRRSGLGQADFSVMDEGGGRRDP